MNARVLVLVALLGSCAVAERPPVVLTEGGPCGEATVLLDDLCVPIRLTDDQVRQLVIENYLRGYSGPCACPYKFYKPTERVSLDASCTGISAYYPPRRESPICYNSDVSEAMLAAYRRRVSRAASQ